MSKFSKYMIYENDVERVNELSYMGNIGFAEMVQFYQQASDKDIKRMEKVIKKEDWDGFRGLINKILKVKLK